MQIREYRLLPPMAMKVDLGGKKELINPLDWWHDNQYQFKLLASLARRIFVFPQHQPLQSLSSLLLDTPSQSCERL